MQNLINLEQACELLNLKKPTIYKKVCSRQIPFIKLGGKLLFDPEKLEAWVNAHAVEPITIKGN